METEDEETLRIANEWCAEKGDGWQVLDEAGRGGTAPVFTVASPDGPLALKLFNRTFSSGERGTESERRLKPQLDLGLHDCPYLVRVHSGGKFKGRLYILMDKAPGGELEKRLKDVPRDSIRTIVDQIARGMIFLRSEGLSHRDIKSANIFVSDDWSKVTILDLSVLRHVDDPIGLGTDHGDRLPVVATSRYSPPEYLFRLISPGPDLWHALDIYQLGGILHDLIMREPMFEAEYQINRDTNRYRFAWIVATQEPYIAALDVPADLLALVRRALDKDWERRSSLRLDDFLDDSLIQQEQALEAFGIGSARRADPVQVSLMPKSLLENVARFIEDRLKGDFRSRGITTRHRVEQVCEAKCIVILEWDSVPSSSVDIQDIAFKFFLEIESWLSEPIISSKAELHAKLNGSERMKVVKLPPIKCDSNVESKLSDTAWESFSSLAVDVMKS